jgi:hypothetical protein
MSPFLRVKSLPNQERYDQMTDTYTIILDKDTVTQIDRWRSQSAFEPSRRAATRALVRMALKHINYKRQQAAAKAAAPSAAVTASATDTEAHAG